MASCSCAACMAFIAASLRPDQPFDGTGRLGDHLVATCAVPAGDRLPDAVADVLVEQADRDGLQRLVDEDAYCIDVLTQVAAATKALQTANLAFYAPQPLEVVVLVGRVAVHRVLPCR